MSHIDVALKKRSLHRLRIIQGQLEALAKAVDSEVYCTKLLSQSRSIQCSLISLDELLLENHLRSHVIPRAKKPVEAQQVVKELMDIYHLHHK